MASIKIAELHPVGVELFQDGESFLDELNEREMSMLLGAQKSDDVNVSVISLETQSIGISIVTYSVVTQVKKLKIKIK